ncbi:MAG: hypothetical protein Q9218_004699 [Villophora microphyllina]
MSLTDSTVEGPTTTQPHRSHIFAELTTLILNFQISVFTSCNIQLQLANIIIEAAPRQWSLKERKAPGDPE